MMRLPYLLLLPLVACGTPRSAENPNGWYSTGEAYDVQEAVEFTTEPLPRNAAGKLLKPQLRAAAAAAERPA